jgi:hypothetical protein
MKAISKMCQKDSLAPEFDLEGKFLDILNAQNIFWLGIYFSPFLGIFSPIYFLVLFYIDRVRILSFYYKFLKIYKSLLLDKYEILVQDFKQHNPQ